MVGAAAARCTLPPLGHRDCGRLVYWRRTRALLLGRFFPGLSEEGLAWTLLIGFFAGGIVGVPQRQVLHRLRPFLSDWWVPISSLAWGILFPGVVSGFFLARRLPAEDRIG